MKPDAMVDSYPNPPPSTPSLPWRITSAATIVATAAICRSFLFGLNHMEVNGLERFLETLDRRKDIDGRTRGLITVSNHVSVLDDPLIWGVLPLRYAFNPSNHRWGLGSYDICFPNQFLCKFFSFGQVLPTHRKGYSKHAGLFQPTMTQAIRLLSSQPFNHPPKSHDVESSSLEPADPFSTGAFTYTTTGTDRFIAPSAFSSRRYSWVHIFPEGRIHQDPTNSMRYFKWGVSRLILESDPLPEIIPMFIDGCQHVMHESRQWPRFVPRVGKKIKITFGEAVDGEKTFGDLRARWNLLVELQKDAMSKRGEEWNLGMGELTDGLKYGAEAEALRIEVTLRMRSEVSKLRRRLGYPDEDPKAGLMETWIEEGNNECGKKKDGSWLVDG